MSMDPWDIDDGATGSSDSSAPASSEPDVPVVTVSPDTIDHEAINDAVIVGDYIHSATAASPFMGDLYAINGWSFAQWQYNWATNNPSEIGGGSYWADFALNGFKLPGAPEGSGSNGYGRWGGGGGGGSGRAEAIRNLEEVVRNMTGTLGMFTDNATITALATQAVDGRWDQATLEQTVVQKAKDAGWQNLTEDGAIRKMMTGIGDVAAQYLIRMSDDSKAEYAFRIATSEMDQDAILNTIRESAKQQYAWAAKQIDQGMTVRDIVLPLRDTIANELEMAPESIDLMNKKWQRVLTVPNQEGSQRMATTDEVMRQVRQMGEWQNTSSARETTAQTAQYLTRMFGGGII